MLSNTFLWHRQWKREAEGINYKRNMQEASQQKKFTFTHATRTSTSISTLKSKSRPWKIIGLNLKQDINMASILNLMHPGCISPIPGLCVSRPVHGHYVPWPSGHLVPLRARPARWNAWWLSHNLAHIDWGFITILCTMFSIFTRGKPILITTNYKDIIVAPSVTMKRYDWIRMQLQSGDIRDQTWWMEPFMVNCCFDNSRDADLALSRHWFINHQKNMYIAFQLSFYSP